MTTESTGQEAQAKRPFSINEFYEDNKKNVTIGFGVVLLLFVAYFYYSKFYMPAQEQKGQNAIFMAQKYFGLDSTDKALDGTSEYLGAIDVADEFGGTEAGNLAKFYAGRALMDKGEYQEALDYLNDVDFSDEIMAAMVICLQGDCHVELGDVAKGADLYWSAAKKRTNNYTTPYSYIKAGHAYAEIENWSKAAEAYKMVSEEYKNFDTGGIDVEKLQAYATSKARG